MNFKKIITLSFLLFMIFPFAVSAEVCEVEKITIESIEIDNKSDNVVEKNEPVINGRTINLDLAMSEVEDVIRYKMIVKNDSSEDYELDQRKLNESSDYIEYSLEVDDGSNLIKAGEEKVVYLKVEYKNEVDDDSFSGGVYNDSKSLFVNLYSGEENLVNPNTGFKTLLFGIFLIVIVSCAFIQKKKYKYMLLLLGLFSMFPTVYALCKCDLKVESNVEIVKRNLEFCFSSERYSFDSNMTWKDYFDQERSELYLHYSTNKIYRDEDSICGGYLMDDNEHMVHPNDVILSCDEAEYSYYQPAC